LIKILPKTITFLAASIKTGMKACTTGPNVIGCGAALIKAGAVVSAILPAVPTSLPL